MILTGYFNNEVITEICVPKVIDIGTGYEAKKLNFNGAEDTNAEQRPFIVAHPVEITLRIETWLGETLTWTFLPGAQPMPLRRILDHVDNSITTGIQIGY